MASNSRQTYLAEIIKALAENEPSNTTATANALEEIAERIRRRGLVVIMSDFFDNIDDILRALSHFRHKNHDVIIFQILDEREIDFKFGPSAQFIDIETREEMVTQPQQIQKSYSEAMHSFIQNLKKRCRNLNIDYNLITTNLPFDKAMREFVSKRSRM